MQAFSVSYLAVYRTTIGPPDSPINVSEGDVRLTLTPGPISLSFEEPIKSFGPGRAAMRMGGRQVNLPKSSYLIIETLIKTLADGERGRVALVVAEAASLITLRFPYLLDEKLFEGIVNPPGSALVWHEGPMRLTAAPRVAPQFIAEKLQEDFSGVHKLDEQRRARLQLASRWWRRGHEAINQVDRFLFWWTVLEIYPAEGKTKVVNHVVDLLKAKVYPKKEPREIKLKLELGPTSSTRDRIVHNGLSFVPGSEREIFERRLAKLGAVASVCLRLLAGLHPGEELDAFFA